MGALFHKELGMSPKTARRIAREITGGKAAIGVLAEAAEADAFAAMLVEVGGQPESYETQPGRTRNSQAGSRRRKHHYPPLE